MLHINTHIITYSSSSKILTYATWACLKIYVNATDFIQSLGSPRISIQMTRKNKKTKKQKKKVGVGGVEASYLSTSEVQKNTSKSFNRVQTVMGSNIHERQMEICVLLKKLHPGLVNCL